MGMKHLPSGVLCAKRHWMGPSARLVLFEGENKVTIHILTTKRSSGAKIALHIYSDVTEYVYSINEQPFWGVHTIIFISEADIVLFLLTTSI